MKDNTLLIILTIIFVMLVGFSATKLFPNTVLEVVNKDNIEVPVSVQGTTSAPTKINSPITGLSVSTSTPTGNLNGSTFKLDTFNGKAIEATQKYTLSFEGSRFNAKFCNSMGGEYTIQNGIMQSNVVSTEMACGEPADIMLIEGTLASMLTSGAKFTLQGHVLRLVDNLNNVLVFTIFMD